MRRRTPAALIAAIALVAFPASAASPASGAPAWSTMTSPSGAGPISQLNAVSCPATTFCMAVGYYYNPALTQRTLTERWDGKRWVVAASPNAGSKTMASLEAVSCTSAAFCMAVGTFRSGRALRTLSARWNGKLWVLVTAPANGTDGTLRGVSCRTPTFCFAVGDSTQRWNGTAWSVVASTTNLHAVSCTSTTFCFATGSGFARHSTVPITHTERWNGKTWSVVASPNPAHADHSFLYGVSCTSATFCVAVGQSWYGSDHEGVPGYVRWVVEHWNGTAWSITPAPAPKGVTMLTTLNGVSCTGPTSCVAAGYFYRNPGIPTVVERWDGKRWSVAYNPGTIGQLLGASCATATNCMVVGATDLGVNTLIQRYV